MTGETTKEGKSIVRGNVMVKDGKIWSSAEAQEELGKSIDDICTLKLDYKLHSKSGVSTKISGFEFFSN